jgi:coenzyme F420-reducing hydrogenase beta subunit/polysaccharide pyruvyl transferase WcaK-like protein
MEKTGWNDLTAARYLGQYKASYFGYSLLGNFRENAASGGITSTILIDALRQNKIDGALLHRATLVDGEPKSEFIIARTEEEIYQSQGSAYLATLFSFKALPMIREFKGKLAVVCLPCDALILRRMRELEPEIKEKITLVITLFCGHNSEKELTELVIRKLNPEKKAVKSYRYRFGHWRGNLKLEFNDGESVIKPFSFFSDYQNLYFYSQKKCLLCGDQTGFDSDISIGDIWSVKMKSNPIKHNAILVRTEIGKEAIQGLVARNLANIFPVPISELCAGQSRSLPLHASVNARIWAARIFGMKFKMVSEEKPTLLEKAIAWIILFNFSISHSKKWSGIISRLPKFIIKLYLYAFKGLQIFQKPKRISHSIGIIGGSIWGNRGAEAMLVTTVGKLKEKYPDAEFKVFSIYPEKDRKLIRDPKIELLSSKPLYLLLLFMPFSMVYWFFAQFGFQIWIPSSVKRLKECSILFDISGISFSERGLILAYNILTLWPAMLLGVPVVKLSQAIGPFKSPLNKFLARIFLPRCKKVFPRGEISSKFISELNTRMEVSPVSADIAFLYRKDYSLSIENPERISLLKQKVEKWKAAGHKVIIFSPSTVVLKKMTSPKYEVLIQTLIDTIDRPGYNYIFIPNSNREGSKKYQNNDIQVNHKIQEIMQRRSKLEVLSRIEWIDWDINSDGIQQIIQGANLVVTSRFHSMVSALSLGVPLYVIGWGHKYLEILKSFSLEENISDYQNIDINLIAAKLTELLLNEDSFRRSMMEKINTVRESSLIQFDQIKVNFA